MPAPDIIAFARRCARAIRLRPSYVDPEDTVQDACVLIMELGPKWSPDTGIAREAWLWRAVVSGLMFQYGRIRDAERAPHHQREMEPESIPLPDGLAAPPEVLPDARLDREAAENAVGLTREEVAVLKLRYDDGMTQQQIADQLGTYQRHVSRVLAEAEEKIHGFYAQSGVRADSLLAHDVGRAPRGDLRRRRLAAAC